MIGFLFYTICQIPFLQAIDVFHIHLFKDIEDYLSGDGVSNTDGHIEGASSIKWLRDVENVSSNINMGEYECLIH